MSDWGSRWTHNKVAVSVFIRIESFDINVIIFVGSYQWQLIASHLSQSHLFQSGCIDYSFQIFSHFSLVFVLVMHREARVRLWFVCVFISWVTSELCISTLYIISCHHYLLLFSSFYCHCFPCHHPFYSCRFSVLVIIDISITGWRIQTSLIVFSFILFEVNVIQSHRHLSSYSSSFLSSSSTSQSYSPSSSSLLLLFLLFYRLLGESRWFSSSTFLNSLIFFSLLRLSLPCLYALPTFEKARVLSVTLFRNFS